MNHTLGQNRIFSYPQIIFLELLINMLVFTYVHKLWGFPGGTSGKEPACQCRKYKRCKFDPWVRKISWSRSWQPILVFLPGESHGQRHQASGPHTVHGVSKSHTRLKRLSTHACTHTPLILLFDIFF